MEKWIRLLVSLGRTLWFMGYQGGGYSHFDSGAFLSDSSLGILEGKVFRL